MDSTQKVLLPSLTGTFIDETCTIKAEPVKFETARRILEDGDYKCGILNRKFDNLIVDMLDVEMDTKRVKGVKLKAGDEALIVSTGEYVNPNEDYDDAQLDRIAAGCKFLHVSVL